MLPKDFTDKYTILEKVAQGSYGIVYKARCISSKQIVGVKKFKSVSKIGLPISFVREHYLLSVLKGKHVICAIETFCNHDEPLIVMEWMNFNLDQLVAKKVKYPVKEMFKEIVKSLAELHENQVMHRDLKPSNIMFATINKQVLPQPEGAEMNIKDYVVKIIDYGMAKEIDWQDKSLTNMVGTLYFRAPELLLGEKHYGKEIDVWALGCIFYLMLTTQPIFKADNEIQQFKNIISVLGIKKNLITSVSILNRLQKIKIEDREQNWEQIKLQVNEIQLDLLVKMIAFDPSKRWDCPNILKHPYFQ